MLSNHEKLDYHDTGMNYIFHNDKNQEYLEFSNDDVSGYVTYDLYSDTFIIQGHTKDDTKYISYLSSVPLFRNYSYSGSGLPFPNHLLAHENTPNKGQVKVINKCFQIVLLRPSCYYVNQGKTLLKPHIHLKLIESNKIITLVLANHFPYRSLKNLPNNPNRTIGK
jgi:hypothetical protein